MSIGELIGTIGVSLLLIVFALNRIRKIFLLQKPI